MKVNDKSKIKNSLVITIGTFLLLFISLYFYLPNEIKIIQGNEERVSFGFPFRIVAEDDAIDIKNINTSYDYIIKGNKTGSQKINTMIGFIPIRKVDVDVIENTRLIPVGKIAGIRIYEKGVIVLGVDKNINYEIKNENEKLLSGDVIEKINNKKIINKNTIINELKNSKGENIKLEVLRNGEHIILNITPILIDGEDKYKLGVWVRDSTQGIGTITYYNPNKNTLGMLGHAILDVDTGSMFNVRKGKIFDAKVTYIKKGEKGTPGEVMGMINDSDNATIANIKLNSNYGLIANIVKDVNYDRDSMLEVATINEIRLGKAYIISDIVDGIPKRYEVEIEEVSKYGYAINKGMIIKIVDSDLIKATGGIVQGMSGSPIIQNNKIIGAVTHVFIQNPEKGFGIFIEDMIANDI